jgi:glycosyltransferase involved in cell wall biosynthesis
MNRHFISRFSVWLSTAVREVNPGMRRWHIITGEYPPQPGGVSDYTRLVARELARTGDEVKVWAPQCAQSPDGEAGVRVHRLPGHFGPLSLAALNREVTAAANDRILVQYVPHAFGFKGMNLPFCAWLYARRRWSIDVMFHEVTFPRRAAQPLRHNLLGEVTALMAMLVGRSAARLFVSSLAWEAILRPLVGQRKSIEWLPVVSTIPVIEDPCATKAIRASLAPAGQSVVGHLGTYGLGIRRFLETALPELLRSEHVTVILLGRNGAGLRDAIMQRRPDAASRVRAAGELTARQLSLHLAACDLMLQPYPDGISTRRTSAMAALAHGRPVVSTLGRLSERLWTESGALAAVSAENSGALVATTQSLLENRSERERLGLAASRLYQERFHIRHTIDSLRAEDAGFAS